MQKRITPEIQITVTSQYLEDESRPEDFQFLFAYKVSIKNLGESAAQLMSRHWIIIDSLGRKEEVRGPGVVGVQPRIVPNQVYEYDSSCSLNSSSGSMKGTYSMISSNGEPFTVEIPEFYLIAPNALN